MKYLALLSLVSLATATPLSLLSGNEQVPFSNLADHITSYPGFDLDLSAQRLVQLEGQEPVWMTELEKVSNFCVTVL